MTVGRESPAVMVRMPDELKLWLKHQAIDNRRSLNSEVLLRLEQSRSQQEASAEKQPVAAFQAEAGGANINATQPQGEQQ